MLPIIEPEFTEFTWDDDINWFPPSLLDPSFEYVRSEATDVRKTWAKYGWQPARKAP